MKKNLDGFIGLIGDATPLANDDFTEFNGTCIGVRNGNLQIRDSEDNVYEINPSQFNPDED